jgi:hypothetical protein
MTPVLFQVDGDCRRWNVLLKVVDCVRQCQRRLERILQTGAKRGVNKPTPDDVEHARVCSVLLLLLATNLQCCGLAKATVRLTS